ncbi:MAG: hypothetical protein DRN06_04020 [Thermoprotei archaeon]|nr:MAG: hypothetical protein DRN06_04020 [Thermoprotei archaeon]
MRIVALGDSVTLSYGGDRSPWISHTWPAILGRILSSNLGEEVEVVNSGVNGDTTRLALARIDRDVFQHKPDLLLVMFGLNDALNVYRRISLGEYENNLRLIVELASHRGVKVAFMTPNPVTERFARFEEGRRLEKLEEYVETVRRVAGDLRIPLIDVFKLFEEEYYKSLIRDGVHPDYTCQGVIANYVASHLSPTLGGPEVPRVRLHSLVRVWLDDMYNAFTDIVEWRGRFYVTFRVGTAHFVPDAPDGRIAILESRNLVDWSRVAILEVEGWDARDPKFHVIGDKLFLYTQCWSPEERVHKSFAFYTEDGASWEGPVSCGRYVFWRPRRFRGESYVAAYRQGRRGEEWEVHLLRSRDGLEWSYVTTMYRGDMVNETEILFMGEEAVALARVEEPPRRTLILRSRYPFSRWSSCRSSTVLQSPAMLKYKGRVLVSGRVFTREWWGKPFLPEYARTGILVLEGDELKLLTELPSSGDTAYPGMILLDRGRVAVSYYSSHERFLGKDCLDNYRPYTQDYKPGVYLAVISVEW